MAAVQAFCSRCPAGGAEVPPPRQLPKYAVNGIKCRIGGRTFAAQKSLQNNR